LPREVLCIEAHVVERATSTVIDCGTVRKLGPCRPPCLCLRLHRPETGLVYDVDMAPDAVHMLREQRRQRAGSEMRQEILCRFPDLPIRDRKSTRLNSS